MVYLLFGFWLKCRYCCLPGSNASFYICSFFRCRAVLKSQMADTFLTQNNTKAPNCQLPCRKIATKHFKHNPKKTKIWQFVCPKMIMVLIVFVKQIISGKCQWRKLQLKWYVKKFQLQSFLERKTLHVILKINIKAKKSPLYFRMRVKNVTIFAEP